MYGKQAKIGQFDKSFLKFIIGGSKVAKKLRFEVRQIMYVIEQIFCRQNILDLEIQGSPKFYYKIFAPMICTIILR